MAAFNDRSEISIRLPIRHMQICRINPLISTFAKDFIPPEKMKNDSIVHHLKD